ncbi:MAG: hypothetical protein WAM39_16780 [Bryobacteraceae bacterium]
MNPRTKQNLNIAMQSEAFALAKYLRFAAHARMNENWDLANLFQTAADTGRIEHFAKEADLAGLVTNEYDNLKDAMDEKRAQASMYDRFARQAIADGDTAAAELFEKIREENVTQALAFETTLLIQAGERSACLVEA